MADIKKLGRKVGVEVEFNNHTGSPLDKWCGVWCGDVHEDGSCGWEAVTPPLTPKELEPCLKALGEALKDTGCDNRCGIHVHVDARDITWPDMYKILQVYAKVEGALFVLGGQDRYFNNYSSTVGPEYAEAVSVTKDRRYRVLQVALTDLPHSDRNLFGNMRKEYLRVSDVGKKHGGRYKAINIIPWIAGRFKGKEDTTIEFRLHRGTHDMERVWQWANLCSNIISWSCKATKGEIAKLPKSPMKALAVISPESAGYIVQRLKYWKKNTSPVKDEYKRKRKGEKGTGPLANARKLSTLALYSGRAEAIKAARLPFQEVCRQLHSLRTASNADIDREVRRTLPGSDTLPTVSLPAETTPPASDRPSGAPLPESIIADSIAHYQHCGHRGCVNCNSYIRAINPEGVRRAEEAEEVRRRLERLQAMNAALQGAQ